MNENKFDTYIKERLKSNRNTLPDLISERIDTTLILLPGRKNQRKRVLIISIAAAAIIVCVVAIKLAPSSFTQKIASLPLIGELFNTEKTDTGNTGNKVYKFNQPLQSTYKDTTISVKKVELDSASTRVELSITCPAGGFMGFEILDNNGMHLYTNKNESLSGRLIGSNQIDNFLLEFSSISNGAEYFIIRPYFIYERTAINLPEKYPAVVSSGIGSGGVNETVTLTNIEFSEGKALVYYTVEGNVMYPTIFMDFTNGTVSMAKNINVMQIGESTFAHTDELSIPGKDKIKSIYISRLVDDPQMLKQLEIRIPVK